MFINKMILIWLIVIFTGVATPDCFAYSEERYIEKLQSPNLQVRIGALKNLNYALSKDGYELSDQLKKICYQIIEEEAAGKVIINAITDEEAQYPSEIGLLIVNINDDVTLPYLVKQGLGKMGRQAMLKHGQKALQMALDNAPNIQKSNPYRQHGYILLMKDFIEKRPDGYVATGNMREKIKQTINGIYSGIKYPAKENQNYQALKDDISRELLDPLLDFYLELGDEDIVPIVEKIAAENDYKKVYRKKYYKYLKMDPKELIKHQDETEKLFKEDDREKERMGASAFKNEEKVIEYPVRDKAKKILEELKKKNNVQ